jgi:hypothetical protein
MKALSQSETFAIGDISNQPRPRRLLPLGLSSAAVTLMLALGAFTIAAADTDVCEQTAQAVFQSGELSAISDYRLAFAKAFNITEPAARKAAKEEASEDLKDARATNKEQRAARLAACEKLGDGAYDPVIKPANFVYGVTNPYFPLTPGKTYIYEGQTLQGFEHSEFEVTRNTKVILGVTCVEVRDTVKHDGVLTEDTLDWFAQDKEGNVWYFGENTHELEDGLITTIDGTFMAGVNGDKPGIIMKALPKVGDFYRQEFSLANAEDLAETLSVHEKVTMNAGTFTDCVKSQETTPLETDLLEHKFYCPGIGNVLTVDAKTGEKLELVRIETQ